MWRKGAGYDGINHLKGGLIDRGNVYMFVPARSFPRSFLFEHYLDEETVVERGGKRLRTIEKW